MRGAFCFKPFATPAAWHVAAIALLMSLGGAAHAESAMRATGNGPLSASAHLDFRITVLSSLSVAMRPDAVHIQSNAGGLVVQQDDRAYVAARATAEPGPLQRRMVDTSLPASTLAGATMLTVATP